MARISAVFVILGVISMTWPLAAATVTITAETCADLTEHVPDASVAYRPGVDSDGDAVAPATLGGGFQVEPPREITIPIQISPGPKSSLYSTSDTTIGKVTYRDGRVWYNGRPVQDEEAARISRLCQERLDAGASKPKNIPHRHGKK